MADSPLLSQLWTRLAEEGHVKVSPGPMLAPTRAHALDVFSAIAETTTSGTSQTFKAAAFWNGGAWRPTYSVTSPAFKDMHVLVPGNPPEFRAVSADSAEVVSRDLGHPVDEVLRHLIEHSFTGLQHFAVKQAQGWTVPQLAANRDAVAYVLHLTELVERFNVSWHGVALALPEPASAAVKLMASDWLPASRGGGVE